MRSSGLEALVFLGSPWGPDPESLHQIGLSVSDFAIHDATLDHLFILQANRRAVLDAKETVQRLAEETRERARLEMVERALEYDLNASGDLSIRIDDELRIVEARITRRSGELADLADRVGTLLPEALPLLGSVVERLIPDLRDEALAFEAGLGADGGAPYFAFRCIRTLSGHILILGRDISERRALEEKLRRYALHDSLTGLANRRFLEEQIDLARRQVRSARSAGSLALMLIDLDDFKRTNDTYGHSVGDDLLIAAAERIGEAVRKTDVAARIGGDEFAVLLTGLTHPDQAWEIASRTLATLTRPLERAGRALAIAASIGVVVDDGNAERADLFRDADLALYRAKKDGKGTVELFQGELRARAVRRVRLKKDIDRGIAEREFSLEYQPVVDLESHTMVGVEALCRWDHPELGRISPFEFIEIAEENRQIVPLGRYIIEAAVQQKALWNAEPHAQQLHLAINLSRHQLLDDGLLPALEDLLTSSGVDPRTLTFEVTESLVMRDIDRSLAMLETLRALGARIAMDDFGRDYSSLGELERLPIDVLKVDKIFVDRLLEGESWPLTETIVSLGQALGFTVIAEGIEETRQLEILREMRCKLGQGYLFARPETPEAIGARILASERGSVIIPPEKK